jgi:hypothetical protein
MAINKKLWLIFPILIIAILAYNKSNPPQSISSKASVLPEVTGASQQLMLHTGGVLSIRAVNEAPTRQVSDLTESGRTIKAVLRSLRTPQITPDSKLPVFDDFIRRVSDGQADFVRGLYVQDILALQVVQQPQGDPAFIDRQEDTATQFQSAALHGTIGLLAHNFLAGRHFFRLQSGQDLVLVYGDGRFQHFSVSEIADYQRLTPTDLHSDFVELASNLQLSADQVFAKFYQRAQTLVLQTCIEREGNPDWGVRFIVGEPIQ